MSASARRDAQRRLRPEETLSCEQLDRLILDAALDGAGAAEIQRRLREARELLAEGLTLDERGRVMWAI